MWGFSCCCFFVCVFHAFLVDFDRGMFLEFRCGKCTVVKKTFRMDFFSACDLSESFAEVQRNSGTDA